AEAPVSASPRPPMPERPAMPERPPVPERLRQEEPERLTPREPSNAHQLRREAMSEVRRDLGREPVEDKPRTAPAQSRGRMRSLEGTPQQTDSRMVWIGVLVASLFMATVGGGLLASLLGLALVAFVVLFLIGPFIGLYGKPEIKHERFVEPVDGAQTATIDLNLPVAEARVGPLADRNNLIDADLVYYGDIDFSASGLRDRRVTLRQVNMGRNLGMFNPLVYMSGKEKLVWDVKLNPDIPTELTINAGAGDVRLDLSEMELMFLKLQCALGAMKVFLPASRRRYMATINGGAGETRVTVPRGALLDMDVNGGVGHTELSFSSDSDARVRIRGGVGDVQIDLPPDLPVQVRASVGVGDLNLPSRFRKVTKEERFVGQSGLWQTDNFREGDPAVIIEYSGGVGSLKVR
ncbi:MAG: hypothetical protein IT323_09840, partial [Anaerolineae bacterium]|nr:hypothetical protein [Anaerolineae bacterium]